MAKEAVRLLIYRLERTYDTPALTKVIEFFLHTSWLLRSFSEAKQGKGQPKNRSEAELDEVKINEILMILDTRNKQKNLFLNVEHLLNYSIYLSIT